VKVKIASFRSTLVGRAAFNKGLGRRRIVLFDLLDIKSVDRGSLITPNLRCMRRSEQRLDAALAASPGLPGHKSGSLPQSIRDSGTVI
jgi:hypothetical protein